MDKDDITNIFFFILIYGLFCLLNTIGREYSITEFIVYLSSCILFAYVLSQYMIYKRKAEIQLKYSKFVERKLIDELFERAKLIFKENRRK